MNCLDGLPLEVLLHISSLLEPIDLYNLISVSPSFQAICCVFCDEQSEVYLEGELPNSPRVLICDLDMNSDLELLPHPIQVFGISDTVLLQRCLSAISSKFLNKPILKVILIDGLYNKNPPLTEMDFYSPSCLLFLKNLKEFEIMTTFITPDSIIVHDVSNLSFRQHGSLYQNNGHFRLRFIKNLTLFLRRIDDIDSINAFDFEVPSTVKHLCLDISEYKHEFWFSERNESLLPLVPLRLCFLTMNLTTFTISTKLPIVLEHLKFPVLIKLEIDLIGELDYPLTSHMDDIIMMELKDLYIRIFDYSYFQEQRPLIKKIATGSKLKKIVIKLNQPSEKFFKNYPKSQLSKSKPEWISETKFDDVENFQFIY